MARPCAFSLLFLCLAGCEGAVGSNASEDNGDDTIHPQTDAGALDAGTDAGALIDGGAPPDAGTLDAGVADAGLNDGGNPRDAGPPDAGPPKPAFVVHPRSQWEDPATPVTSTSLMAVGSLEFITVHYNGDVLDLDGADNVYQDQDFVSILRNIQAAYVRDRGYAIGYNSAIAPNGDEWVLRGFDYRTAANGCVAANVPGYAILIPVPTPTSAPTATQVAGLKAAIARVRGVIASKGNTRTIVINGHNAIRTLKCGSGTGCPGPYFEALIDAGTLDR